MSTYAARRSGPLTRGPASSFDKLRGDATSFKPIPETWVTTLFRDMPNPIGPVGLPPAETPAAGRRGFIGQGLS